MSTTTSPDGTRAGTGSTRDGNGNGNGSGAAGNGLATPSRRPGPQERAAFVACIAAVIVYLVLAYVVFVRPGVRREDHVLAVLLPAAILALSAELYPRLPAGLRASLALFFGVIGIVAGVVQVDRLQVEGFSAAALCGVLPLAAGVVLVVMGVWLAWTSRKRGGPLWWTILRRALIVGRRAVHRVLGRPSRRAWPSSRRSGRTPPSGSGTSGALTRRSR